MFKNISVAGTGSYALIAVILAHTAKMVLDYYGYHFELPALVDGAEQILAAVGAIMAVVGTFRRPELTVGIIRK